jgi:hypothetical protein
MSDSYFCLGGGLPAGTPPASYFTGGAIVRPEGGMVTVLAGALVAPSNSPSPFV